MRFSTSPILESSRDSIATSQSQPIVLKRALRQLVQDGPAQGLRIELPTSGAHRVRELVHRGTQRPVSKLASIKLGRVVQCESALEVDAVRILDAHGAVSAFCEQPLRIRYYLEGRAHHHVPDLAAISNEGRLSLLEVKFQSDVDEAIQSRTAVLQRALGEIGVHYKLLTEHQIREGDGVQRAIRVLRRARHGTCQVQLIAVWERLRRLGCTELSAFEWDVPGSAVACSIARLLVQGHASLDAGAPLTGRTLVRASEGPMTEVLPW
ncbi:hypothetical protein [Xanthomonas tesorieronis]|uniref:hypothetical protein n=1 Tax=Xanthomonas tesorieronis TaxID=3160839 RepID=UPI00351540E4